MYDKAMHGGLGKHKEEALGPAGGVREDVLQEMTSELSLERGQGINQMTMTDGMKQTPGSKDTRTGVSSMCARDVGPESGHSRC